MKLIKKINNNFALGEDGNGEKIIIQAKGIGFVPYPSELKDLSKVERTYYGYDDRYVELLNSVPLEVIQVANMIQAYLMTRINCSLNPNLPFTLGDHIWFAIQRISKGIDANLPKDYNLRHFYPIEFDTAEYALKVIYKYPKVKLPPNEKTGIVLNLVNAEMAGKNKEQVENDKYIDDITYMISHSLNITINKDSANYARFVTHMNYMFKRIQERIPTQTENRLMYDEFNQQYPDVSKCVDNIADMLRNKAGISLNKEEKLYLIIHVNRLCSRGKIDQK